MLSTESIMLRIEGAHRFTMCTLRKKPIGKACFPNRFFVQKAYADYVGMTFHSQHDQFC